MRLWSKAGLLEVLATDNGFWFFRFDSVEACSAILEEGPWYIASHPLILKKWVPREPLTKDPLSSLPVWVKLHGIPVEYWNDEVLSKVGTLLGKPLYVDSLTDEGKHISFARICVEVSAEEELIKDFELELENSNGDCVVTQVSAEFQGVPIRCPSCKVFGHCCLIKPPAAPVAKQKSTSEWVQVARRSGNSCREGEASTSLDPMIVDPPAEALQTLVEAQPSQR